MKVVAEVIAAGLIAGVLITLTMGRWNKQPISDDDDIHGGVV